MAETAERSQSWWPKHPDTHEAVVTLIREATKRVEQPGRSLKYSHRVNGSRKPRRSFRGEEFTQLIHLITDFGLPRELRMLSGKLQLVVYAVQEGAPVELIRLTPLHIPSGIHNRKMRYRQAASIFRALVNHPENLNLLRDLGLTPPDAKD